MTVVTIVTMFWERAWYVKHRHDRHTSSRFQFQGDAPATVGARYFLVYYAEIVQHCPCVDVELERQDVRFQIHAEPFRQLGRCSRPFGNFGGDKLCNLLQKRFGRRFPHLRFRALEIPRERFLVSHEQNLLFLLVAPRHLKRRLV